MKKIVKKHYKILIGIVIGIIISTTIVYSAENILSGSDVLYNNGNGTNNVQNEIDELYEKANSCTNSNKNIISAYIYSESGENKCINGEENTCQETECYKDKKEKSCSQGTIIKYRVKDNEEHYFYVLHDEEEKITMQQRENTVYNIKWSNKSTNEEGPTAVLPVLENATEDWINVNVIEYQPGVTILYENKYTGCDISSLDCTSNRYTMSQRTVRARMITVQEAENLGCNKGYYTCPIWIYNYLYDSTKYGGTNDDTHTENNAIANDGYWTMSATSNYSGYAWVMMNPGKTNYSSPSSTISSARAVVEINK